MRVRKVTVKPLKQVVVDVGAVMQCVRRLEQQLVSFVDPAGVDRLSVSDGRDLVARESNSVGEERDVDAPFVLASTSGAGAIDDDLAVRIVSESRLLSS